MSTSQSVLAQGEATPAAHHEHAWITESRHRTSEGVVLYVRCAACARRRIDLQAAPERPPHGITRLVEPAREQSVTAES